MTTLQRLRKWIEGMLELEARATPGELVVQSLVNPDECVTRVPGSGINNWVAGFVGSAKQQDAALHVAARNSFRAFLATTLEQIATVLACDVCRGTGREKRYAPEGANYTVPCERCPAVSLLQLAQKVLAPERAGAGR